MRARHLLVFVLAMLACAIQFPPFDAEAAGDRIDYGTTCLALVGYSEARGEGDAGMAAVMATVLARIESSRRLRTVCEVVEERGQYLGVERWPYPRHPEHDEPRAWSRSLAIAEQLLGGDLSLVPAECRGAEYFDRGGSEVPGLVPACRFGRHTFYRDAAAADEARREASRARTPTTRAVTADLGRD